MPYNYKYIRAQRTVHAQPKLLQNALHRARLRHRLSTHGLATKAGVTLCTTQRVLRGQCAQVSFWTMARLAKALGLDLNYLAGLNPGQKGRPHGDYTIF
jgi:transcriptional regulator with XRE-family HTH domain